MNAPTNLDRLLELVLRYEDTPATDYSGCVEEYERIMATPPWDGAPMKHDELDMTSLPTFGGTEPADTSGVWSWDSTRLLVGAGGDDLEIVDRVSTENKITCMEEEHRKAKAAGVCHECFESLGDCSC